MESKYDIMLPSHPPKPNPVIMTDDLESIDKIISSINLTLQSNYKQLLTETANFKIQINILLKSTPAGEKFNSVLELKEKIKPIKKQIQVFSHIFTLKSFSSE